MLHFSLRDWIHVFAYLYAVGAWGLTSGAFTYHGALVLEALGVAVALTYTGALAMGLPLMCSVISPQSELGVAQICRGGDVFT